MKTSTAHRIAPSAPTEGFPKVREVIAHDRDFVPELHRSRLAASAPHLYEEMMTKKTASTSDAKQKRQTKSKK